MKSERNLHCPITAAPCVRAYIDGTQRLYVPMRLRALDAVDRRAEPLETER